MQVKILRTVHDMIYIMGRTSIFMIKSYFCVRNIGIQTSGGVGGWWLGEQFDEQD